MLPNHQLFESWGKIPRTLYIHKLMGTPSEYTQEALDKLVKSKTFTNSKNIYCYTFIHPDSNIVIPFIASELPAPNKKFKMWPFEFSPLRNVIYKGSGGQQGMSNDLSSEKIASQKFKTTAFLFSGEENLFNKVMTFKTKNISTTVPIPLPGGVILYQHYNMDCNENKHNVTNIDIKKLKILTMPQFVLKSNYFFVYNCLVT